MTQRKINNDREKGIKGKGQQPRASELPKLRLGRSGSNTWPESDTSDQRWREKELIGRWNKKQVEQIFSDKVQL